MSKKLLALLLAVVMIVGLVPMTVMAAETVPVEWDTLTLKRENGTSLVEGKDYTIDQQEYNAGLDFSTMTTIKVPYNIYKIITTDTVVISGGGSTKPKDTVIKCELVFATGSNAKVTFDNVTALKSVTVENGKELDITLKNTNYIDYVYVNGYESSVVIGGEGSFIGKQIGSKIEADCGKITINSGIINVDNSASTADAAIGGGKNGKVNDIIINGGTINAKGAYGAGIGCGQGGVGSDLTINGGDITANASYAAAIGGGRTLSGDPVSVAPEITITGGDIKVSSSRGNLIGAGENGKATSTTVSGGSFNFDITSVATIDLPEGCKPKEVEGKWVIEAPAGNVAKIGDAEFATLADAVAALPAAVEADSTAVLTLIDENAWDKATPVYFNGNFYSTLSAAINAANAANEVGGGNIVVRPNFNNDPNSSSIKGADHPSLKTDITIYGNKAKLNFGWEPCVEYTGTSYHTLENDISVAIYSLDNGAGFWGIRTSDYTVNVTLENCTNAHEIMINGNAGSDKSVTNVTVKNCTFDKAHYGQDCPITTTNPGKVDVENCTFTNMDGDYTFNINNKNGGKIVVEAKNLEFNNCGTAAKAPFRLMGEAEGSELEASLDNVSFTGSNNSADIIVGKASATDNKASVSYSIVNTAAKIDVYKAGSADKDEEKSGTIEASTTPTIGDNAAAQAVAKIGTTEYATLKEALDAVNKQEGDDVIVEILCDITEEFEAEYYFNKNVTITANESVKVDLVNPENVCILVNNQGHKLVIDENVTLTNLCGLYIYAQKAIIDISGKVDAQLLWPIYNGTVNINPTARVKMGYGDGMMTFRFGGTVNVTGSLASGEALTADLSKTEQQLSGGYIQSKKEGTHALNLKDTYMSTAWMINTTGTFNTTLDNAVFQLAQNGNMSKYAAVNGALTLKNNSRLISLEGGVELGADYTANIEVGSIITASNFTNNGEIIVDLTDATAESYTIIDCTGTANYGEEGTNYKVIGNDDYVLQVVENDLVAVIHESEYSVDVDMTLPETVPSEKQTEVEALISETATQNTETKTSLETAIGATVEANESVLVDALKKDNPELAEEITDEKITEKKLEIKFSKVEVKYDAINSITYDVTPVVVAKVDNTEIKAELHELATPITFKLAVNFAKDTKVIVYHGDVLLGEYVVDGEEDNTYVTITSKTFSPFTIEGKTINNVTAKKETRGSTFKFNTASLTVADGLILNIKATATSYNDTAFTDSFMTATVDDKTTVLEFVEDAYKCEVAPEHIGSNITFKLYAKDADRNIYEVDFNYSVEQYCTSQLSSNKINSIMNTETLKAEGVLFYKDQPTVVIRPEYLAQAQATLAEAENAPALEAYTNTFNTVYLPNEKNVALQALLENILKYGEAAGSNIEYSEYKSNADTEFYKGKGKNITNQTLSVTGNFAPSATLILGSKVGITFGFTAEGNLTEAKAVFDEVKPAGETSETAIYTVEGDVNIKSVTAFGNENVQENATTYTVSFDGFNATELDDMVTYTITVDGSTFTVNTSIYHLLSQVTEDQSTLAEAVQNYGLAADYYAYIEYEISQLKK